MLLRLADGWVFRRFTDGDALLYHPSSGELLALAPASSDLADVLAARPLCREEALSAALAAASARRGGGATAEIEEMARHLDEFVRLGIVHTIQP